ncbi:MAG: aminotransferase class V-fold PLP-dependent enzyme, partial [candidate division Zixibacteria bacterium]|nr:aminotransferase class V-fold PLP-dependent enzyme [candidate division Zixibacteria bacterium]
TVIFTKNASEALNKLANRFPFSDDSIVLSSLMEHHSNDLPWRRRAKVIYVEVDESGSLDLNDLEKKLRKYQGKIQLLTLIGASNVTGYVNPLHQIASLAHRYDAKIIVDAAQFMSHRPLDMKMDGDPEHIDYLIFSAHKMYAPFGTGVLIGPKSTFQRGEPEHVGGGTVELVTLDEVEWTGLPDREEVGSPNVVGAVALAEAIKILKEMGMDNIAGHERKLTQYAIKKLRSIKAVTIHGNQDYVENPALRLAQGGESFNFVQDKRSRTTEGGDEDRLGVIPFNLTGFHHSLVSAILSYEQGIGVRHGCFCAHPYVNRLLGTTEEQSIRLRAEIKRGNKANLPGAVRISFGFYNTEEEIDQLIDALEKISRREYKGKYRLDERLGEYLPENFSFDYKKYFDF